MLHSVSTRGRFLIAALIYFLSAIILVFIMPFAVTETIYNREDYLLLAIPFTNFSYFALSLGSILLCIILLAFKRSMATILLSVAVTIGAIFLSVHALTGYITIQDDSIAVKTLWNEQSYEWDHMSQIVFEYEGNRGDFIFTFDDGSEYVLPYSGSIGSKGKSLIYTKSNAFNIPFSEIPKP